MESAWSEPGLGSFPIAFFILYRLVFLSYSLLFLPRHIQQRIHDND